MRPFEIFSHFATILMMAAQLAITKLFFTVFAGSFLLFSKTVINESFSFYISRLTLENLIVARISGKVY